MERGLHLSGKVAVCEPACKRATVDTTSVGVTMAHVCTAKTGCRGKYFPCCTMLLTVAKEAVKTDAERLEYGMISPRRSPRLAGRDATLQPAPSTYAQACAQAAAATVTGPSSRKEGKRPIEASPTRPRGLASGMGARMPGRMMPATPVTGGQSRSAPTSTKRPRSDQHAARASSSAQGAANTFNALDIQNRFNALATEEGVVGMAE